VTSAWNDLSRPPLSAARLARAFSGEGLWRDVRIIAATASTNADVAELARVGAAEGLVVVAEQQTAGRGRLDREWQSPPRAGVLLSALLRPPVDVAAWPMIPLLAGLAVVEALLAVGQVEAGLKWPNDVLVDELKLGGILVERVDDAVVVGIGVNVSTRAGELPVATATSLALVGGATDREILVKEILRSLDRRYTAWRDTAGSSATVIPAYRERCETIGHHVDVQLPGGDVVRGLASGIDDDGRLLVDDDAGDHHAFLVGDVTHVRKVS
jgi:BirA family transcriptional regulator, biotin operon repressor / biotin---[acetyl-CoA-carboxylase] ligase